MKSSASLVRKKPGDVMSASTLPNRDIAVLYRLALIESPIIKDPVIIAADIDNPIATIILVRQ
jgi:hypothetical protein